MKRVVVIVGTRADAIKMVPVHRALAAAAGWKPIVVSTGQHRELLETALRSLGVARDHDLDVMVPEQTLNGLVSSVLDRLPPLLEAIRPDLVLVQGDTTSAFAAALAAYHLRIPVGHVEAGLRTHDHEHPFPEEANRQLVDRLATFCFAPTPRARAHLLAEGIPDDRIFVTGNTAVDSLRWALERSTTRCPEGTVLVTLHRRESFGAPLREIVLGLRDFLEAHPTASALWPVHPNPNLARALEDLALGCPRLVSTPPRDYVAFVGLLATCRFVLTDSGGIQEEAPSLGKTVLIARETTERPEALGGSSGDGLALDAGRNRLVGRSRERLRAHLAAAWAEPSHPGPVPLPNPYGDGHAADRIVAALSVSRSP